MASSQWWSPWALRSPLKPAACVTHYISKTTSASIHGCTASVLHDLNRGVNTVMFKAVSGWIWIMGVERKGSAARGLQKLLKMEIKGITGRTKWKDSDSLSVTKGLEEKRRAQRLSALKHRQIHQHLHFFCLHFSEGRAPYSCGSYITQYFKNGNMNSTCSDRNSCTAHD